MNGYEIRLTFDFLPVLGVVMSLAGFYLPFFKDWYSTLSPGWKQGFMALLLILLPLIAALGSVVGILTIYPTQWNLALWYALVDAVIALCVNAGIYKAFNRIVDG